MDIKDFIVPTVLKNDDNNQENYGDKRFRTEDLVYIDHYNDVKDLSNEERICFPTDYAIMNGVLVSPYRWEPQNRRTCHTWLRSGESCFDASIIDLYGDLWNQDVGDTENSLRPALRLNLGAVISARSASNEAFKLGEYIVGRTVKYHTIEFGEYPKTYVGDKLNQCLEKEWLRGKLVATGRKYTGSLVYERPSYNREYVYLDKRYVRVETLIADVDSEFLDGTSDLQNGNSLWVKVEPITWIIKNWDGMPKEINPKGTGKEKTMDIQTEEAIIFGIPFYLDCNNKNCSMWQNSTIRGYLNGYNVNNITTNGNKRYTAPKGGDFREHNFLTEAFSGELSLAKNAKEVNKDVEKKQRKGYGIKVLDKPMTINEQIKFYIENGKSFMLHGPSGIGKTRRIQEADPNFVSIVLRNGILPEEVIGKTIYPNNDKTKSGIWRPPAWYIQLCEICEREPDKQHVLFIDEITNVKPSEQSLVYHLVLNNSIGPNVGKLPQNVVVVAAGNNKEESEAAYNMPEPLFRRFDGHIELKPDIQSWLEWGSEQSDKGDGRLKVHPLVANFVGSYGSQVFYSPYDSEDPPKYAIDPRGWEQVSDIIYDNKGLIAKELIENKVGKEIAATFVSFAQTPLLCVEDILNKNYDYNDIPVQFDAKYALALSLRRASIEEIQQVREFISHELGKEILAMFDLVWVGDDNEKAIHLASLQKLKDDNGSSLSDDGRNLPF